MSDVYPLIFRPILKPRLWGGNRLKPLLGKNTPNGTRIGESWEVADLEEDQSVVANGPASGRTIREMVTEWGAALTGRAPLSDGRFPLLIKFLDAGESLSVQVHPDAAAAIRLGGEVRVKHEAWYVIEADANSVIYRGLQNGVDAPKLRAAIRDHQVSALLKQIPARNGHCYYLPSGTVHALGAGITVAEVQTPSDVTYRIHDWDRLDPETGQPRQLHIEEALHCVSFSSIPTETEVPRHVASYWTTVTSLVRCESFVIERVRMLEGMEQIIPYNEMVVWIVLEGHGSIVQEAAPHRIAFGPGDTVVLPAALSAARVRTQSECMWLEVSVPVPSSLAGYDRPQRESPSPVRQAVPSGPVSLGLPGDVSNRNA